MKQLIGFNKSPKIKRNSVLNYFFWYKKSFIINYEASLYTIMRELIAIRFHALMVVTAMIISAIYSSEKRVVAFS